MMSKLERFLTVYDYGSGAQWVYLMANSREEIEEQFRDLEIVDEPPDWMKSADLAKIRTVDVNDPTDKFLAALRKRRST